MFPLSVLTSSEELATVGPLIRELISAPSPLQTEASSRCCQSGLQHTGRSGGSRGSPCPLSGQDARDLVTLSASLPSLIMADLFIARLSGSLKNSLCFCELIFTYSSQEDSRALWVDMIPLPRKSRLLSRTCRGQPLVPPLCWRQRDSRESKTIELELRTLHYGLCLGVRYALELQAATLRGTEDSCSLESLEGLGKQ